MSVFDPLVFAREILDLECQALKKTSLKLGDDFLRAIHLIDQMTGKVVVSGVGKSGIVGQKISSTMASLGIVSVFLHAYEGLHGDLGIVAPQDVIILISNSGETREILDLFPFIKRQGNNVIAITGDVSSSLAEFADFVIDSSVDREACPYNLAPTSSSTVTIAIGDALALAVAKVKGFSEDDFARLHPGGSLGKRLLSKVMDFMISEKLPVCFENTTFRDVIFSMTKGRLGLVLVIDSNKKLIGIITDGDLRRFFQEKFSLVSLESCTADKIMTKNPVCVQKFMSVSEAEAVMRIKKINSLVVVDSNEKVLGVFGFNT